MASPYTLLMTEDQEVAYDAGVIDGRDKERERIIKLLEEDADANYYALRIIKGENK